ncbi:citryl-CoA lyase [Microbacterium pseudoresistens]|uniref:citrate synthase (unknown stereospecificity) n=1 Tax=Microbacterium pseudoresistens TaxID=640634 RepID=A0A7Y9JMB8_9MICO|nr:citryl-CoA lyase [Microbacterium pseudoresistens]NYD54607.1 citrate synthase [Microbacterium pseudoresistens]
MNETRSTDARYPTALGYSTPTSITLLGDDLAQDLMGKVGFGELSYRLVTRRRPSPGQTRVFEAVLVALADHGLTPTSIVTRLTYLSAPDSVQGALAAGLLGGGSRFLGVTQDTGAFLCDALERQQRDGGTLPRSSGEWDALASHAVAEAHAAGRHVPGLGHHIHKKADPRTARMMQIARENECFGPHLELFAAIGRVHPDLLGRTLPLNGAGVCGAALLDAGIPASLLRGIALLARAAGLLGQLSEEMAAPSAYRMFLELESGAEPMDPTPAG